MWYTTKDGKHINTDWFDQDRQIEENERQAKERNNEPEDLNGLSYQQTKEWFQKNSNLDEWNEELEDFDYNNTPKDEWWKFDVSEALYTYAGEKFAWINSWLRTGKMNPPKGAYDDEHRKTDIRDIDYAISKFSLNKPLTVYRSSDSSLLGKEKMTYEQMRSMVGKTVNDKAYVSTSTVRELPGEQTVGGEVNYVINVPKGKGVGAYIPKFSENPQEREFLLARGMDYKIVDVRKDKYGTAVVHLEVKK